MQVITFQIWVQHVTSLASDFPLVDLEAGVLCDFCPGPLLLRLPHVLFGVLRSLQWNRFLQRIPFFSFSLYRFTFLKTYQSLVRDLPRLWPENLRAAIMTESPIEHRPGSWVAGPQIWVDKIHESTAGSSLHDSQSLLSLIFFIEM